MNAYAMNIFAAAVQRDTEIDRHEKRPAVPVSGRREKPCIFAAKPPLCSPVNPPNKGVRHG
jgi:hypothetical protein